MNWIAFRKTTIGIVAALGFGCLIAIVIQAGMKDFFGLTLTTKVTAALGGIGIVFKWCYDYIIDYLKEIKTTIGKKVDIVTLEDYKQSQYNRDEEIMSLLNHISDSIHNLFCNIAYD